MRVDFHWHAYRYLPYEQVLARRELMALLGQEPALKSKGLSIESQNKWKESAYRTTYFSEAVAENGSKIVPLQAILEATANGWPYGGLSDIKNAPLLHRQSTRYSAHGLHEYRGKFNPQVVRAIGNILRLQPDDWVLDPFCGSGTVLLEATHIGWNAMGIDINPLAVQIARAKIEAMHVPLTLLCTHTEALKKRLYKRLRNKSFGRISTKKEIKIVSNTGRYLPSFDYLRAWFVESTLVEILMIMEEIDLLSSEKVRRILRVILSDILREVSLQDPTDLRIRRRKSPPENASVIPLYLDAVTKKLERIFKAREHLANITTIQDALLGDTRYCATVIKTQPRVKKNEQFDAAITSPPYATALPYVDTQRLSLVLFGLIRADEIRSTEKVLIGNRELTNRERMRIEEAMGTNANHLPSECLSLCYKLKRSLDKNKDGFRRQNVPALMYKYLTDMALMFIQVHKLLKKNAPFALVVGRNSTCLGGRTFVIDTPYFLTLLAEDNGFTIQETLELNTYYRFDIHQANSIRSETLLILKRR